MKITSQYLATWLTISGPTGHTERWGFYPSSGLCLCWGFQARPAESAGKRLCEDALSPIQGELAPVTLVPFPMTRPFSAKGTQSAESSVLSHKAGDPLSIECLSGRRKLWSTQQNLPLSLTHCLGLSLGITETPLVLGHSTFHVTGDSPDAEPNPVSTPPSPLPPLSPSCSEA